MKKRYRLIGMLLLAMLAAACNSNAVATSGPDRIATGVAEAKAIAATLTAGAPTLVVAQVNPTDTPKAAPPPAKPTVAAPEPPTPTDTPIPQAADEFVPGVGEPKGLSGGILLPGYSGPLDAPAFSNWVNIRLKVFDPDAGDQDGAGITAVNFTVTDPTGKTVVDQRESSAAYCAFANPQGSSDCNVWDFKERGNLWPNGTAICEGVYSVQITVDADNPDRDDAVWNFQFVVKSPDGSLPPC